MAANGQPAAQSSILVVEDDPVLRALVSTLLSGEGFEVETAADGEAGWAALEQRPFNLLLTDHEMPRLKGLDLIARVRSRSRAIPAILMSGTITRDGVDAEALEVADFFLAKPFSVEELRNVVRKFLPAC